MRSSLELTVETRIKQLGLPEPVAEFNFKGLNGKRRFRFDFAWPSEGIALEIEGGSFNRGRHTRGVGFHNDCEKYNEAVLCGWRIIRADSSMVHDDSWIPFVELALKETI
jgi:hypothetical protein